MNGIHIFNEVIRNNLIYNRDFLSGRASYIPAFSRIFSALKKRERQRSFLFESEDLTVPPILIISVTNDCNLACEGCYANSQDRCRDDELSIADIDRIVAEASDSGVGIVFIAGGEPLMKEGLLELPRRYRDVLFVMFTNGMLLTNETADKTGALKNLVPVFSLEGDEEATDRRRGSGVFKAVKTVMQTLDERRAMFGASVTLTRVNYGKIMTAEYLASLDESGCRTLFLIEYVPCEGDPENCLTEEQKADLLKQLPDIQSRYRMLTVALPGNEEQYGGCLAAGRGFLHISSTGHIEACPFAPFSDVNLKDMSFREALRSRMLEKIRENHHLLEEAEGGCTLFENQKWVGELIGSK